jgi:conjugal transfer ATP-binding protein TraC
MSTPAPAQKVSVLGYLSAIPRMVLGSLLPTPQDYIDMLARAQFPLPYYDYDIDDHIYHLADGGCGIAFRCLPQYGLNEVMSGLRSMYSTLPEGAHVQIIMWANPNTNNIVNAWKNNKTLYEGLYGEIIKDLDSFFSGKSGLITRNYCLYITIKLGGKDRPQTIFSFKKGEGYKDEYSKKYQILKENYNRIKGALEAAKLYPANCDPDEMISFVYTVLNLNHDHKYIPRWDGSAQMSDFCIANDTPIEVNKRYVSVDGMFGKSLSVKDYPEDWALYLSDMYTGRVHGGLTIETPMLVSLNVTKCDKKYMDMTSKRAHIVLNQKLPEALFPRLRMKQKDYEYSNIKLAQGDPLYLVNLSLFVFADTLDKLDSVVGQVKSYYQTHFFRLEEDIYINHSSLLAMLPFNWDDEIANHLKRGRAVFIDSCIDLSPISADNSGHNPAELLFVTPRGQLHGFDLFADEAGGFNAFVIGTTGAGKSVLMEYIALNYLLSETRIFIIDIGGSYKRFCNAFDGEYIEIDPEEPLCLNPWTDILDDKMFHEFQPFLADWYYMMGAPLDIQMSNQLEKLIKSSLNTALERSWKRYGNSSCVDTVISELEEINNTDKDARISDFIKTISPYSSTGAYADFFNGQSEINFHSKLVVLENGKMENIPELRDPIIMILTYHISKHIYVHEAQSSFRHIVIMDEAHKFLGNPKIDLFVDQAYRRFRKSGASMIVGTQGFEDLYNGQNSSKAGQTIVYKIFMLQSSVSRQRIKQSNLFNLSGYYEEMLDSVLPLSGIYSELMVIHERYMVKLRLYLPELLKALFFTGKEIRMKIESLVKNNGLTYIEAVKQIAEEQKNGN